MLLFIIFVLSYCAAAAANLTLTPAQVLLPQTSYYVSAGSKEAVAIYVQVLLRVEPRVCVNWEVQNTSLLRLFPPNTEAVRMDSPSYHSSGSGEACFNSIWISSVPNLGSALLSYDNVESFRSWVFAYDPSTKYRTGAEVIISPVRSIQFETRNRRISVNQIATLKIIAHDSFSNTFTSLEGIPFEAKIEDFNIMQIIDIRNDPEVATETRLSLLENKDRYLMEKNYVLTSDVIVLQGKTVGKTRISLRVMLPEYKDIVLNDVEFTVSESIVLEPPKLVISPGSKFKFCIRKIKPQAANGQWDFKIDYRNYTWISDVERGQKLRFDGTLIAGTDEGIDFKVILKDKRNDEIFSAEVLVRIPNSLGVSYGNVYDILECLSSKGVGVNFYGGDEEELKKSLDGLYTEIYSNCMGGIRCGKYLTGGIKSKPLVYLLSGRYYLWDVTMRDLDDIQMYITQDTTFNWTFDENNDVIRIVWKSHNGRFSLIETLKEGLTEFSVELGGVADSKDGPHVKMGITLAVTNPVFIVGFPFETIRWGLASSQTNVESLKLETIGVSLKPLIVPVNETIRISWKGGSGEYSYRTDDEAICTISHGILRTKSCGTTVLSISDSLNSENIFKIQVIVSRIRRIEFDESSVHIECGETAVLRILGFADLSGIRPIFQDEWATPISREMEQFYACSPSFSHMEDPVESKKTNLRLESDKFMLDLVKTTEEMFTCGLFHYLALNTGKTDVVFSLSDRSSAESLELTAVATVEIYDRLSISVHPDFTYFPLSSPPQPVRSVSQGMGDKTTFANLPIGGKVRILITGGPPTHIEDLVVSTCVKDSEYLHIERVNSGTTDREFDIYCLSEADSEKICIMMGGSVRSEYSINCRTPKYVEIYPLVSINNRSVYDNLSLTDSYFRRWGDHGSPNGGVFTTGASLCQINEGGNQWQLKINREEWHVFQAVIFDPFGCPLLPSHSWKISWSGSATTKTLKSDKINLEKINNSVFVYRSDEMAEVDLVANLEWPGTLDVKHTCPEVIEKVKPKTVASLISLVKKWKASDKRGIYILTDSLRLVPTLPHHILIGAGKFSSQEHVAAENLDLVNFNVEKRISIFFSPKIRYQFAVVLGSGNYIELAAYSETVKFQHTATFYFNSVQEFDRSVTGFDGTINLFYPLTINKYLIEEGENGQISYKASTIPVRYMNFVCSHPCSRSLEVVDRGQLGQQTKGIIISQSQVAKLRIMLSEILEGDFEDFDALSTWSESLNLVCVKRLYRLHAVGVDSNGIPMLYASLKEVEFSVSSESMKLTPPKEHGYKAVGNCMVAQFLVEGKYTITATIRNYNGPSDIPDGSFVADSLEVMAYKETKPILSSILMLPNSPELQLGMLENSLSKSSLQFLMMESSDESVLMLTRSTDIGYIQSKNCGSCILNSYMASGQNSKSKFVVPVTVSVPHSVSINLDPSQTILEGKTLTLVSQVYDKQGHVFTPLYLAGIQESMDKSYCQFQWTVEGGGVFIYGNRMLKTVSGVGELRVILFAKSPGSISVQVKITCKNMGASVGNTITLASKKSYMECISPMNIFGVQNRCSQIILASGFTYETKNNITELLTTDKDLISIKSNNLIKTEAKLGHALLKTVDNYVSHVQVDDIGSLHIETVDDNSNDIGMLKNGKKRLSVFLRAKDGQEIVPPNKFRLKVFLSHPSLLDVKAEGIYINLVANLAEGCSSLLVQLDDKNEQYSVDNIKIDIVRVCVNNSLIPRDSTVIKGSTVRFLAGSVQHYTFQLRGIPLVQKFSSVDFQENSLEFFQDALEVSMDLILNTIKEDLSRAVSNVLRTSVVNSHSDIGDSSSVPGIVDDIAIELFTPIIDVSLGKGVLKPLYVFPFSINSNRHSQMDVSEFMDKLTLQLSELAADGGIFSMMEGGVSPLFDSSGGWESSDPSLFWVKGSQGLALQSGEAVVNFEDMDKKGNSKLTVYDTLDKVELQHYCHPHSIAKDTNFRSDLTHRECYKPFSIVFKGYHNQSDSVVVLKNTLQFDSKVVAICGFTSDRPDDAWIEEVFKFDSTFVLNGDFEYLPACEVQIRGSMGHEEWDRLRNILKNSKDIASAIRLNLMLYSTLPRGYKACHLSLEKHKSKQNKKSLFLILRNADKLLWQKAFDWKLPRIAQFVDDQGVAITEIYFKQNSTVQLSVYPFYANSKLVVDSKHYAVNIVELQGLYCSFTISSHGLCEPANAKVIYQKQTIASLMLKSDTTSRKSISVDFNGTFGDNTAIVETGKGSDALLTVFTGIIAAILAYLVYTLLHRSEPTFYEPAEPIKIERKIPNVFEKLYQTDYVGSIANNTAHYQHRRNR